MAYSFTSSESLGVPEQITLVDTTPAPAPGLTHREVFLRLANGNYLTTLGESNSPASTIWPIGDNSITISILTNSTSPDLTVNWMTNSTVTGTSEVPTCFDAFDYIFAYGLIGDQTSSPGIIQDATYYSNFIRFIVNIFNAETAISIGGDIYSSQQALNANLVMQNNQQDYF